MNIILIGGSGFIGTHLYDILKIDHNVTVFDTKQSKYIDNVIIGDILDPDIVNEVISNQDIVINVAGIADIELCTNNSVKAAEINIIGNLNLLEASVKHNIKRFIFASSAYVFGNHGSIYKNTKQSCELFIQSYQKLHNLNYTIIRYGSLYGTRSDANNSIYRLLTQALKHNKIDYKGTGNEIREYINVKDAANLTLKLLADEYINQHILLTGLTQTTSKNLNDIINSMLNNKIEIKYLNEKSESHYNTTPFSFEPIVGKKLINNEYINLESGLLEIMREINLKGDDK